MTAETITDVADKAHATEAAAKKAAKAAIDEGQRSFAEAVSAAESRFGDVAKQLEKVLKEGIETLRTQTRGYTENAGEQFDDAQKYVLERVKERPVTATLAGLGVGLLLGLLLANRSK